jgi:hypothetical protein
VSPKKGAFARADHSTVELGKRVSEGKILTLYTDSYRGLGRVKLHTNAPPVRFQCVTATHTGQLKSVLIPTIHCYLFTQKIQAILTYKQMHGVQPISGTNTGLVRQEIRRLSRFTAMFTKARQ